MASNLVKAIILGAMVAGATLSNAQISFQSGNGIAGGTDSMVTVMDGPSTADFNTLGATDFANFASNAHAAYILSPLASGWVTGLGGGSTAQWVGVNPTSGNNANSSDTSLFAISFSSATAMQNATLNLTFSVDDQLGGINNEGIFIDGNAIAGSSSSVLWDGMVQNSTYSLGNLGAGSHTLYFDDVNSGAGPSGMIFQGTVQSVPEPMPFAALGMGLVGILARRAKKRA